MTNTEGNIAGMTVNERLFYYSLFDKFEIAEKSRNLNEMIKILLLAKFSEQQANQTASAIISNPTMYGF